MAKDCSKCIAFRSISLAASIRRLNGVTEDELPDDRVFVCYPHIADDAPEGWTEDNAFDVAMQFDVPDDATDIAVLERKDVHRT